MSSQGCLDPVLCTVPSINHQDTQLQQETETVDNRLKIEAPIKKENDPFQTQPQKKKNVHNFSLSYSNKMSLGKVSFLFFLLIFTEKANQGSHSL